jgi:predicted transcriptional regulator
MWREDSDRSDDALPRHYTRPMTDEVQRDEPATITVADVMVSNVLVVHSGDSVDDAVRLIVDSRITSVPVVDD